MLLAIFKFGAPYSFKYLSTTPPAIFGFIRTRSTYIRSLREHTFRLGSPYRTSSNRTEPYRAFASRIASPLGIFEREPNRIEGGMYGTVRFGMDSPLCPTLFESRAWMVFMKLYSARLRHSMNGTESLLDLLTAPMRII